MKQRLRLGTRGSALALKQAHGVREALIARFAELEIELVEIRTLAEKFPEKAAAELGVGIFTREIDAALSRGEIDFAVHSLKDVPTQLPEGIVLAAVPERESPLDVFISRDGTRFEDLPPGAKIGTGSLRRQAQILHRRPDLQVVPLRGNVETRVRKMHELGLAGIVLAHAGLIRLGQEGRIAQVFPPEFLLPAPGQGLLGVTARASDGAVLEALRAIDHRPSRLQAEAERAFLRRLRGGCLVPAGALARGPEGEGAGARLRLEALIAAPDGSECIRGEMAGEAEAARRIGERLAEELLERGGARIIAAASPKAPLRGKRIAIARSEEESSALRARLEAAGAEAFALPVLKHSLRAESASLSSAAREAASYSLLVFSSPAAVRLFALACEKEGIAIEVFVEDPTAVRAVTRGIRQALSGTPVRITDADIEGVRDADDKLVLLAKQMHCPIITNDYNLNRVAELQGVRVLNINELANAVRAVFLPGESLHVKVIQEGKEPGQGVGYLDDGTMVVVEDGSTWIGRDVEVVVTKVLQTAAGRMLFARLLG